MRMYRGRQMGKTKKRAAAGWRRYLNAALLVVLVTAGTALAVAAYRIFPKVLPVREVLFSGQRHLAEAELRSIAAVRDGEGMLAVSAKAIAGRLLQMPWVRAVSVRKEYPGRVCIDIREAEPFAILDRKGQSFLIDERGQILERIQGDSVPFLPIINGDPARAETFSEALRLAAVIRERKIATERGRVEVIATGKGPEDLAVVVDKVVIKVGEGDYEQKLDRLFSLEGEIRKRAVSIDYVDLRFANRVVVKPLAEVIR